jgi:hypothetical protein
MSWDPVAAVILIRQMQPPEITGVTILIGRGVADEVGAGDDIVKGHAAFQTRLQGWGQRCDCAYSLGDQRKACF